MPWKSPRKPLKPRPVGRFWGFQLRQNQEGFQYLGIGLQECKKQLPALFKGPGLQKECFSLFQLQYGAGFQPEF